MVKIVYLSFYFAFDQPRYHVISRASTEPLAVTASTCIAGARFVIIVDFFCFFFHSRVAMSLLRAFFFMVYPGAKMENGSGPSHETTGLTTQPTSFQRLASGEKSLNDSRARSKPLGPLFPGLEILLSDGRTTIVFVSVTIAVIELTAIKALTPDTVTF